MKQTIVRVGLIAMVSLCACGASQEPQVTPAGTTMTTSTGAPNASGSPSVATPAPSASVPGKPERPFAKTHEEATHLVDEAISQAIAPISKCVQEARDRRKDVHAEVTFDVGVDQEGVLIGVKAPKGAKADTALYECVREALRDAPFPKSHAGVLTVTKVYTDKAINK